MQRTQLNTTSLETTELEITRASFGVWAIRGGGWEFGWGRQADEESIGAIHRALELGVSTGSIPWPTALAIRSRSSAARSRGSTRPQVLSLTSTISTRLRAGSKR
jgi:hypothetical protein